MGDVGVRRTTAELSLDLDRIKGGLVFGVDRSQVQDAVDAVHRVEAELVVVRERAERLEQELAETTLALAAALAQEDE